MHTSEVQRCSSAFRTRPLNFGPVALSACCPIPFLSRSTKLMLHEGASIKAARGLDATRRKELSSQAQVRQPELHPLSSHEPISRSVGHKSGGAKGPFGRGRLPRRRRQLRRAAATPTVLQSYHHDPSHGVPPALPLIWWSRLTSESPPPKFPEKERARPMIARIVFARGYVEDRERHTDPLVPPPLPSPG